MTDTRVAVSAATSLEQDHTPVVRLDWRRLHIRHVEALAHVGRHARGHGERGGGGHFEMPMLAVWTLVRGAPVLSAL